MPHILDLPNNTLEAMFALLPQRELAGIVTLVCKRFKQTCDCSSLWREIEAAFGVGDEGRSRSFCLWLRARDRRVRRLQVCVELDLVADLAADTTGFQAIFNARTIFTNAVSAVHATARSLQELELQLLSNQSYFFPLPLHIDELLAPLVSLEKAHISADMLVLGQGLGGLRQLRKLALHSPRLDGLLLGEDGWMPPALVKLGLGCVGRGLPRGLGTATSLQALALNNRSLAGTNLGSLAQLTGLLELHLTRCGLTSLPAELSALPQLRMLYLPHNELGKAGQLGWEPLQNLQHLAFLSLSHCHLRALPPALLGMASLQGLHLEGNEGVASLLHGPYLAGLRELALDWALLLASHAPLAQHAARLSRLVAAAGCPAPRSGPPGGEGGTRAGRVGSLLRSLAALPSLRHFVHATAGEEDGEGNGPGLGPRGSSLDADVALCLLRLGRACPWLILDVVEGEGFGWSMEDVLPP